MSQEASSKKKYKAENGFPFGPFGYSQVLFAAWCKAPWKIPCGDLRCGQPSDKGEVIAKGFDKTSKAFLPRFLRL